MRKLASPALLMLAMLRLPILAATSNPIAWAKRQPDGTPVVLNGIVATSSYGELPSMIYIEDIGRSSGIQSCIGTSTPTDVVDGAIVSVTGVMTTKSSGERAVNGAVLTVTGTTTPLQPLGIRNRMIGGSSFGLQNGVLNGIGMNNIGLLIKTWGWVKSFDSAGGYFTISDGSRTDIRVDCSRLTNKPSLGDYVYVKGIVSTIKDCTSGTLTAILVPRRQNDVNTCNPYFETQLAQPVPQGKVALYWLGQGGWLIKDHEGNCIAIDPLLSDYKRSSDPVYMRLMSVPIPPERLNPGLTLITHTHGDHLDPWTLKPIRDNSQSEFWGPTTCSDRMKSGSVGIPQNRIKTINRGDKITWHGIGITAMYANHPYTATPDAVGYFLEITGKRIYISGDTLYDATLLNAVMEEHPDVIMICINGASGNMSAADAAQLVKQCNPQVAIPMHYGMFAINTADPQSFVQECILQGVTSTVTVLGVCGYMVL